LYTSTLGPTAAPLGTTRRLDFEVCADDVRAGSIDFDIDCPTLSVSASSSVTPVDAFAHIAGALRDDRATRSDGGIVISVLDEPTDVLRLINSSSISDND